MGALSGRCESLRLTSRKLVLENAGMLRALPGLPSVPSNQHIGRKRLWRYTAAEFFVAYELKKAHSWMPGETVVHPQTCEWGVPYRDERHSYQECGWQYSHPGAWGLHVG